MAQPFGKYFFEIGIYRCTEDQYGAELGIATEKHIQWLWGRTGIAPDPTSDSYKRTEQYAWKKCGGPWLYNQAIGWLRLYVLGPRIGADLFFTEKRIQHNVKTKEFRYSGKAFELFFGRDATSEKIHEKIRVTLMELSADRRLRKRYVDVEPFDNIAPYIPWRRLIGLDK
jgi:hypothetical protein